LEGKYQKGKKKESEKMDGGCKDACLYRFVESSKKGQVRL
jgi:hypothetical protein